MPLAERLSQPSRFDGDPDDAVTVIVPALPGFPLSPPRPRMDEPTHEPLAPADDGGAGLRAVRGARPTSARESRRAWRRRIRRRWRGST
ncbi:hypothetical protein [Clavibacter tessellarius]|uniref:hypothetical protein n=1 Tax=Clavibacter tessellarius TaxID=31965 RepID=UPI0039BFC362